MEEEEFDARKHIEGILVILNKFVEFNSNTLKHQATGITIMENLHTAVQNVLEVVTIQGERITALEQRKRWWIF